MTPAHHTPPVLRIIHGNPDPGEIAAVVTVLASVRTPEVAAAPAPTRRNWGAPASLLRTSVHPDGWWPSGLPR